MHVNVNKSKLEHTCKPTEGAEAGGRKRQHNTSVLLAASSPARTVLKNTGSSESLVSSVAALGLPPMSKKQAQKFVREENTTSWEQFVVELHHLPQFMADLKRADPEGTYECEKKPDVYNGIEVQTFHRYFVSWGAAKLIVCDSPLLYLVALDGGHMKSAFGGVCLAAVIVTANSRLFPAAWAVVDSENEHNCVWFAERFLKTFPDIDFVWMTDQGTALTCDAMEQLLEDHDQIPSFCAKHVIKTLEVARSKKEISGPMSGVRELIYNFARCRTVERGDAVLSEIRKKNPDVANYLRDRRDKIEAASFLRAARKRGGRITSQLVESFFGMCRPFREKGFVEGIIWLCNKFQTVQLEERKLLQRWLDKGYTGERVACLSRAASMKFHDLVHAQSDSFEVRIVVKSALELVGDVVKVADGSARRIRITRGGVAGPIQIDCPCLMRQEIGLPCGRSVQLMLSGGWCDGGLPVDCVSAFLTAQAWKQQCNVNVVVPAVPEWLANFNKSNPAAAMKAALAEADEQLALLPARIPCLAGRPKLHKRSKKRLNNHFPRLRSATEKGDAQKKNKSNKAKVAELQMEGEDEAILFDGEVEEVGEEEEDCRDGDCEKEDGAVHDTRGHDVHATDVPSVGNVTTIADLFRVGSKVSKTPKADAECRSCGGTGHKWPKCRARSIELMLVKINVMPEIKETVAVLGTGPSEAAAVLAPVARLAGAPAAARAVTLAPQNDLSHMADWEDVAVDAVSRSSATPAARKRSALSDACVVCRGEVAHEEWRAFGRKCVMCKFSFAHFACATGLQWTCDHCGHAGEAQE